MLEIDYKKDFNFCKIVDLVINTEGGYSNNHNDYGGPTQFGVAWNYHHDSLSEWWGLTDIRQITKDQAKQLYYVKFWINYQCHKIPDLALAYLHFDSAVQHSSKCMSFLGLLPYHYKYYAGNGSNKEVWAANCHVYFAFRQRYYTSLSNAQWREFGKGWMNRMADVILNIDKLRRGII